MIDLVLRPWLLTFFLFYSISSAQTPGTQSSQSRVQNYLAQRVYKDIHTGSIVEGSVNFGGIQPHYIIDFDHQAFDPIRNYARSIKDASVKLKVELLKDFINQHVLIFQDYDTPAYLRLLAEYKRAGKNIPLSSYLKIKAGVCREHALIFHMALKEAGVPNNYMYGPVYQGSQVEDHAVNVIKINGELRVLDSYNENFHNKPLSQLLSPRGTMGGGYRIGIKSLPEYPVVHSDQPTPSYKTKKRFSEFGKASRCPGNLRETLLRLTQK